MFTWNKYNERITDKPDEPASPSAFSDMLGMRPFALWLAVYRLRRTNDHILSKWDEKPRRDKRCISARHSESAGRVEVS